MLESRLEPHTNRNGFFLSSSVSVFMLARLLLESMTNKRTTPRYVLPHFINSGSNLI
jgi:hypothetical protein